MIKYSFLSESRKQFLKALRRYSPEEQRSIMKRLIDSGSELDAEEYGKRMYVGQMKRLSKLASGNNRRVGTVTDPYIKKWGILPNGLISDDFITKGMNSNKRVARITTSGKDTVVIPPMKKGQSLQYADALAHEADEYSRMLHFSKQHSPEEVYVKSTSPHFPGVLRRERKRETELSRLYQMNPLHNRTRQDYIDEPKRLV